MNILVTHASKMGGTQGLAEAIAAGLGEGAVVMPVDAVKRLVGYDAVVVGGGLYAGRWTGAGRRFVAATPRSCERRTSGSSAAAPSTTRPTSTRSIRRGRSGG